MKTPATIHEQQLREMFGQNFERLRLENGHSLSPDVREAAWEQVRLYWRKLRHIAETVTDTEVKLNLPNQKTPKKRIFCIEGVVDIVRENEKVTMYDLKTTSVFIWTCCTKTVPMRLVTTTKPTFTTILRSGKRMTFQTQRNAVVGLRLVRFLVAAIQTVCVPALSGSFARSHSRFHKEPARPSSKRCVAFIKQFFMMKSSRSH